MNKEFEFLNIISNTISNPDFLGDDCAYLKEYNLAISSDTLIEDVHFSQKYMNPYEIAKKAMLVNISDILSSGATAKYATISLGGKLNNTFIEEFYKGIKEIEEEYKINIIGGDLVKSEKIIISITIFGDYKNKNISSRKNARENYIVATVGNFGHSAKGLIELKEGLKNSEFIKAHKTPCIYPDISNEIATKTKKPYAMMDSSDGLFDCLYQIATKSKIKIEIEYNKISTKIKDKELVLFGGEDYSLVICIDENDFNRIEGLNKIGLCKTGTGVYIDNKQLNYQAFKHF